jgi:hypothetical protein
LQRGVELAGHLTRRFILRTPRVDHCRGQIILHLRKCERALCRDEFVAALARLEPHRDEADEEGDQHQRGIDADAL